jgi:hypothetical protein
VEKKKRQQNSAS